MFNIFFFGQETRMTRVSLMGMTAGISTEKDFIIYFTTCDVNIAVLIQLGYKYRMIYQTIWS